MDLPRKRLTTRRLMAWGVVVAVWLAVVRAYLVASRRVHQQGRHGWYRQTAKARPLTKAESGDAARLAEELSQAGI